MHATNELVNKRCMADQAGQEAIGGFNDVAFLKEVARMDAFDVGMNRSVKTHSLSFSCFLHEREMSLVPVPTTLSPITLIFYDDDAGTGRERETQMLRRNRVYCGPALPHPVLRHPRPPDRPSDGPTTQWASDTMHVHSHFPSARSFLDQSPSIV